MDADARGAQARALFCSLRFDEVGSRSSSPRLLLEKSLYEHRDLTLHGGDELLCVGCLLFIQLPCIVDRGTLDVPEVLQRQGDLVDCSTTRDDV